MQPIRHIRVRKSISGLSKSWEEPPASTEYREIKNLIRNEKD